MRRFLPGVVRTATRRQLRTSTTLLENGTRAASPLVPRSSPAARAAELLAGPTSPVQNPTASSSPSVSLTHKQSHDADTGLRASDVFRPDQTLNVCRAALIAAIHPPSTSRRPTKPDPHAVLQAASSFLDKGYHLPPAHLNTISSVLSEHFVDNAVSEEEMSALFAVMAACCLSPESVDVVTSRSGSSKNAVTGRFIDILRAEYRRGESNLARLGRATDAFEQQLKVYGQGMLLTWAYTATWAMLREKLGRRNPADIEGLQLPIARKVIDTAKRMQLEHVAEETINVMCDAFEQLPSTTDALQTRLASARNAQDLKDAWDRFQAIPQDHALQSHKDEALAHFVSAVRKRRDATASERETLVALNVSIAQQYEQAMPLPVLHALLSTNPLSPKAEAEPPASSSEEMGKDKSDHKDRVVADAHKSWKDFKAHGGIADVRAYLLYLGVLGRYHNTTDLFKIWDEMVGDKACRAAYEKEITTASKDQPKNSWPPTIVLNQVLSSAYLIGGPAAEMATHLYQLSLDSTSPIAPDIITINTTLRFAAHLANIPMMHKAIADARQVNLTPDIITYTTLVQGLLRADRTDLARKTLDAMRTRGMEPNERMAAMLVSDLAQSGSASGLRRAEDVIRDMRARGIKTSVPMWTSLIAGYFKGGWSADGWSAIQRMRQHGVRLNDVGYNIVLKHSLSGASGNNASREVTGNSVQAAYKLFRDMRNDRVVPTWDTYSIMLGELVRLHRFGKLGSLNELRGVIEDIDARGFKTTKAGLNRLITQARKAVAQSHSRSQSRK